MVEVKREIPVKVTQTQTTRRYLITSPAIGGGREFKLTVEVDDYDLYKGRLRILNSGNKQDFMFQNSRPEVVETIGAMLMKAAELGGVSPSVEAIP